ncbi:hypothetical protein DFH08DRAFT_814230 [Mycena albidolilacea]|uniref:Uncharacterized protein n=1 Tax=Mycena albidolilacea TaxID=1033008 RepID=A0AAD6ZQ79_9AGAR|nr:hypothetical protein DFH08DRAFT_814230 [Mycena albidolilacea]
MSGTLCTLVGRLALRRSDRCRPRLYPSFWSLTFSPSAVSRCFSQTLEAVPPLRELDLRALDTNGKDLSGRLLKPSRSKQASRDLKNAPPRRFEPYPTLATYLVPML